MLIYRQLGSKAQSEFAQTWGVGYALNNVSEFQDVAITAAKAALLIVILDALRVSRNSTWFEECVASASILLRPRHRMLHACADA